MLERMCHRKIAEWIESKHSAGKGQRGKERKTEIRDKTRLKKKN